MKKNCSSSSIYRIKKLKGAVNYQTWELDFKATMVTARLWGHISGRVDAPVPPIEPVPSRVIDLDGHVIVDRVTTEQQNIYQKEQEEYENELITWDEEHEVCMAMLTLACDQEPRIFIKNMTNAKEAYEILKREYGQKMDLAIIDASVQELCRVNCVDKGGLTQYSAHFKHHITVLQQSGITLPPAFLGSIFRMGLPGDQNQYILPLVHSAKRRGVELTIDEMLAVLIDLQKFRAKYP